MNPFIDMVRFTPNEKRYYRRSIAPGLAFLAVMAGAAFLVRSFRDDWAFEVLAGLALLPVLPMVWMMKVYIDYFSDCDEWEKLIEIYGIAIGVLLVGMAYFALGLLGLFKLVVLDGTLLAYCMLPAVMLVYSLGKVFGRWRHG
jgi:hypothetical protein